MTLRPMTITQKIFARASGRDYVTPGETVWLNVDTLMTHDVCGPPTFQIWKREFGEDAKIWDKDKVAIFPDHYIFTKNAQANRNVDILRQFAKEHDLPHYYDVGTPRYKGVCHIAMAEEGFNVPGSVVFGTDSHTCTAGAFGLFATGVGNTDAAFIMGTGKIWEKVPETMRFEFSGSLPAHLTAKDLILKTIGEIGTDGATYRAMEFDGNAVYDLSIEERMTLTNMAIEAGGMSGIIAPDQKTVDYIKPRMKPGRQIENLKSDSNAEYYSEHRFNVSEIEPQIAKPHSPDNVTGVSSVKGTSLTKAYIGSCTGGKLFDFLSAARILKGKKVKIPTLLVPASTQIGRELHEVQYEGETLASILSQAGCQIAESSCAACLGGPSDTVGRSQDGDIVISTTNRNYPGRMGSKKSEVYLASPLTVASSALNGVISDPREVL